MIQKFKNKGTENIFNGKNTKEAKKLCPRSLWHIASRKLDHIDSVQFLKERTFDNSDKFVYWVCNDCGTVAIVNTAKNLYKCNGCGEKSTGFTKIQAPYAQKLLFQELLGLGIMPRIRTKNSTF